MFPELPRGGNTAKVFPGVQFAAEEPDAEALVRKVPRQLSKNVKKFEFGQERIRFARWTGSTSNPRLDGRGAKNRSHDDQ